MGSDVSESVTDLEEPFRVAVTVAVWSASSAPVLAVKVAEVALAATVTEGGTVGRMGRCWRAQLRCCWRRISDRVTVQVVLALEARLAAAH